MINTKQGIKNVLIENNVNVNERISSMNLVTSKFRRFVKLHEETRPIKPVVNFIQ